MSLLIHILLSVTSMSVLEPLNLLILVSSGIAAGLVNAVAGGGTFFSFAALIAVGLPPVTANATSSIAMVPGYASSAFAYRSEIAEQGRRLFLPGLASAIGGLIGGLLLVRMGNASFASMVPWLLLVATVLFIFGPAISRWLRPGTASAPLMNSRLLVLAAVGQLIVSIYGGFFGAGMGIVLLAILSLTEGSDFHRANAAKHLHSILIQLTAVTLFIYNGLISWPEALVVTLAAMIGGWLGVKLARKVPVHLVRGAVQVLAIGMTIWFFWRAA